MPTGVTYRDAMLRHQMLLERVKGGFYLGFNSVLRELADETRIILQLHAPENMADITRPQRTKVARLVLAAQRRLFDNWIQEFLASNKELMNIDRVLASQILEATQSAASNVSAARFLARATGPQALWADILAEPIGANGQTMEEMLEYFRNNAGSKIVERIAKASVNDETKAETLKAITGGARTNEGLFRLFRANSRAIIATTMQHTSTSTHRNVQSATFDTYRWISVLDERTTDICRGRHNKIFDYATGPRPPAHFNCRSTIAPGIDSSADASANGEALPDDGDEWLAQQLAVVATSLVGARIGERKVADLMATAHTRPMSLDRLANSADIITRGR